MTNFDNNLKQALKSVPLDQAGIIEMAVSIFRGRQRFFTIISVIVSLAFMAIMAWCAVQFFQTTEVRALILYATVFLMLGGALSMLKLWFWLMMLRYSIACDLKRMELHLSQGRA